MNNKRKPLNEKLDKFIFGREEQNGKPADGSKQTRQSEQDLEKEPNDLLDKLIKDSPRKEKPIRVSLDLSPDMHKKLTNLANRTGRKKSEILRILLEQAFDEINIE
ncbi:ribbon-helix-helix protein, CopG family [Komarekiella sp. 'clone 1']|uniref:Ribbon-helix-helix protein, CopG family n=1 Tax=Komarekiella delphini-convector SJRDD-AB1 TaxID=2593771 RepID=A0AA40T3S5_9NOST|nr:ribbon-helix-helix domain-containing protein [Komarekiella delphini-convector]MBD6620418.1 ribbon-helix-helix protein, CopG family [Komarekiella delphini-convector SJRDD-AB1]